MKQHYQQIDLLKGLAILSVLILHSIPIEAKHKTFAVFHIWQAMPVFLVLMGFTGGIGFKKTAYRLYLMKWLKRLGYPFLVIFLLSAAFSIFHRSFSFDWRMLIGRLPRSGPGNYFIPLAFGFAILFPLLYKLYKYRPSMMLVVAFMADLAFQLIATRTPLFTAEPFLYSSMPFRYLFAIALGLWISGHPGLYDRQNRFIFLGLLVSLSYLIAFALSGFQIPWFLPVWRTQNLFAAFYPAFLVLAGLKYLPSKGFDWLAFVGKASYHIFLVQILFFGVGLNYGVLVNLGICVLVGLGFQQAESRIRQSFIYIAPASSEVEVKRLVKKA